MAESIAISIPAYNEEATLASVVRQSLAVLGRLANDYEVLIVNDGSVDRTGAIADELARQFPAVRVLHHERNRGFGSTLQHVFAEPQKDWVFFIPGDGQIPPDELETLWQYRGEADFILGWRVNRQDPWRRRVTAWVYNVIISMVLGRRVHDVDSVVLYRREILDAVRLTARSVFLHAEFYLQAAAAGVRMIEIPVSHLPRAGGQARGNRPGVIIETLQELARYLISSHSRR